MSATFEVSWTDFTTNCQRVTQLKGSAIYLLEMRKFLEMSFGDWLSHRLANVSTNLFIYQVVLGCVSLSVVWDSWVVIDSSNFTKVCQLQSLQE
jgi:hypothetical protein